MPKHEKRTQEKLEIKSIILKKESNKAKKQVRFADVEGQGPLIQVIRERRKKLRKKQKQVEKVQKSKNS